MLASPCQLSNLFNSDWTLPHTNKNCSMVLHQKSAHPFQADLRLTTSKYSDSYQPHLCW